jgi:hypothetical protein
MQTRTLIQGWWGPLSALATVVFATLNSFAIASHRRNVPYIQNEHGQFVRVKLNVRKNPVAMILSVIAVFIILSLASTYAAKPTPVDESNPSSYVDTCWNLTSDGTQLQHVKCSDSTAQYIVYQVASLSSMCEDLYMEANNQFACLRRRS